MRKINAIVIHCTATPEGVPVSVESIRRFHVDVRGFSDIGYHWVVALDGTKNPGRPEWAVGAHVKGRNSDTIGISYVGGIDGQGSPKDTRTPAQKRALWELVQEIRSRYGEHLPVHGHYEFANKACPCFTVKQKDFEAGNPPHGAEPHPVEPRPDLLGDVDDFEDEEVPEGPVKIHVVKKGDTIYGLHKGYGISMDDIGRLNGFTGNPNGWLIMPGQKLRLE